LLEIGSSRCHYLIRKLSSFFPDLIAAFNHRGCRLPAQVWEGSCGLRYFGATGLIRPPRRPTSRPLCVGFVQPRELGFEFVSSFGYLFGDCCIDLASEVLKLGNRHRSESHGGSGLRSRRIDLAKVRSARETPCNHGEAGQWMTLGGSMHAFDPKADSRQRHSSLFTST
jgi:hypothetical protein